MFGLAPCKLISTPICKLARSSELFDDGHYEIIKPHSHDDDRSFFRAGRARLKRAVEFFLCLPAESTTSGSLNAARVQSASKDDRKGLITRAAGACLVWVKTKIGLAGPEEDVEAIKRFALAIDNIDLDPLPAYASALRKAIASLDATQTEDLECELGDSVMYGSYNILFPIIFKDGVQWLFKVPATGHANGWNSSAARSLRSEALTMRMLKNKTSIPLPTVYDFDSSMDNEFHCPFILMECMKGKPLHERWYNKFDSPEIREGFRQRVLESLATAMVQLMAFQTSQAGAPSFGDEFTRSSEFPCIIEHTGPVRTFNAPEMHKKMLSKSVDGELLFCDNGPYNTAKDFFLSMLDKHRSPTEEMGIAFHRLLRLFIEWIPSEPASQGDEKFVLAHPDFNLQNVLVAEDGSLQALIDWDGVSTIPSSMACRFPKWLTVDWDPANYNYDIDEEDRGSEATHLSPEDLEHYRGIYAQYMIEAASRLMEDGAGHLKTSPVVPPTQMAEAMAKSLLIDSLNQAAKDPLSTSQIIVKIFEKVARITSSDSSNARNHAFTEAVSETHSLGLSGDIINNLRDNSNTDVLLPRVSGAHRSDAISDSKQMTPCNKAFSESCSDLEECEEKTGKWVMNEEVLNLEGSDYGPHFDVLASLQMISQDTTSTDSPSDSGCTTIRGHDIVSSRSSISSVSNEPRTIPTPYKQRLRDAMMVRGRLDKLKPLFFRSGDHQSEHMRRVAENERQATAGIQQSSPTEDPVKQENIPILARNSSEAQIEVKASLRRRFKAKLRFGREETAEEHQKSSSHAVKLREVHHEFLTRFSSRRRRVKEWLKKIPDTTSDTDEKSPEACYPSIQLAKISCVSSFGISEINGSNSGSERDCRTGGKSSGETLAQDLIILKDSEGPSIPYEDKPVDESKLRAEGFALDQVCYGFVDGTLGEPRMQRLKLGFAALLDSL